MIQSVITIEVCGENRDDINQNFTDIIKLFPALNSCPEQCRTLYDTSHRLVSIMVSYNSIE